MKSAYYISGILTIIILFSLFIIPEEKSQTPAKNINENVTPEEITLTYKDYNYYPNTIKLTANHPVRIYLDDSVKGCLRDFTVKEFRIQKHLETKNDYVEFTPNKKGIFSFACSMGMGQGKIIVE